jgi:hypothetical protein
MRSDIVVGLLSVCMTIGIAGCTDAPNASLVNEHGTIMIADEGLRSPQAVIHDSVADVYLLTNASAGEAFISRVSPGGRVEELRWIGGEGAALRSPKGVAIRGDTLYVADTRCVKLFHRVTAEASGEICPAGADSLAALAVDAEGVIYVGDAGHAASPAVIHTLDPTGTLALLEAGDAIAALRGVAAGPRGVFVTSAGSDYVYHMSSTGPKVLLHGQPKELGGIVTMPDGSFAFSNVSDSTLLFVEANPSHGSGRLWTLVRDLAGPGQPGYDAARRRVLIPETGRDRLHIVSLLPDN